MSLRMIEILVPQPSQGAIETVIEDHNVLASWSSSLPDETIRTSVLVQGATTQEIMEDLETRIQDVQDAHIVLMSVEATLPRPDEMEPEETVDIEHADEAVTEPPSSSTARLSTAELYQDVVEMSEMSRYYLGLIVLSTIVAAMGMIADSTVVIIGAMVIAPLIGPNVGLALSTTLADFDLARESIRTSLIGVMAAFAVSLVLGYGLPFDPLLANEITTRTWVGLPDVALALAAGAAAVLSLSVGVSTALVGVMVAVALLPPLVASGMLVGAGHFEFGAYAGFLAVTNLICINLAGVVTFLLQGVRPNRYWEAEKARQSTAIGIALWAGMMAILLIIIWLVFGFTLTPTTPLP